MIVTASIILGTIAYGLVLRKLGDVMPFIDSFTTVT